MELSWFYENYDWINLLKAMKLFLFSPACAVKDFLDATNLCSLAIVTSSSVVYKIPRCPDSHHQQIPFKAPAVIRLLRQTILKPENHLKEACNILLAWPETVSKVEGNILIHIICNLIFAFYSNMSYHGLSDHCFFSEQILCSSI